MFSLNFMFLCSLIEELCTKEENYKTSCNFNFGHDCIERFCIKNNFEITQRILNLKFVSKISSNSWQFHYLF